MRSGSGCMDGAFVMRSTRHVFGRSAGLLDAADGDAGGAEGLRPPQVCCHNDMHALVRKERQVYL